MHPMLHGHVENHTKLTRKAQLEAYDGCARLRPVWDDIASQYDAVFTPSVVDEAPVGIESTGDAVSCSLFLISFEYLSGQALIQSSRSVACGRFSKLQH
jgi:ADP-dependent phosphofructokinase/glucokinase